MKHDRIWFLNPEVEQEVKASEELWLAWCLTNGRYDWEIDPIHNPDFVKACIQCEADKLSKLKSQIENIKKDRVS